MDWADKIISFLVERQCDLAVLDFDGTLTYTEDLHRRYYKGILEDAFGITGYGIEEHRPIAGKPYHIGWEELSWRYGFDLSSPLLDKLMWARHNDATSQIINLERKPYSWVVPVIDWCHANGVPMAVVTANEVDSVAALLRCWGIGWKLSMICSIVPGKLDKVDAIRRAGEFFGASGNVVFEDSAATLKRCEEELGAAWVGICHPYSADVIGDISSSMGLLVDMVDESRLFSEE